MQAAPYGGKQSTAICFVKYRIVQALRRFFRCIFSGGRPDTWADTTTPHGRLMLTVLGGLAEFERELIHARTGEELSLLAQETPETQSE
jgi:Resolvase, N terminal domain